MHMVQRKGLTRIAPIEAFDSLLNGNECERRAKRTWNGSRLQYGIQLGMFLFHETNASKRQLNTANTKQGLKAEHIFFYRKALGIHGIIPLISFSHSIT